MIKQWEQFLVISLIKTNKKFKLSNVKINMKTVSESSDLYFRIDKQLRDQETICPNY